MNDESGRIDIERVWIWYLLTVIAIVLVFGFDSGSRGGHPGTYLAIHAGLLGGLAIVGRSFRGARVHVVAVAGFTLFALPTVFASLSLVLPALHPEPYEWRWIALDRTLFGADPTVVLQAMLWPPFVELLQWVYASFYFIPIVAMLGAAVAGGRRAFQWALGMVTFAFFLSYLGYLVWPTLPPYRFLHHEQPMTGVFVAEPLC